VKPLLLGEAPAEGGDPARPLAGGPARRLCQLGGLSREGDELWFDALRRYFDTLNAVERREDAYPWRVWRARRRFAEWLVERTGEEDWRPPLVIVALGRRAADAVGLGPKHPWGEWADSGLVVATVAPHPSGLSRIMNAPEMRVLLGRALREAVERAKGAA
jgi:hypothetical protein